MSLLILKIEIPAIRFQKTLRFNPEMSINQACEFIRKSLNSSTLMEPIDMTEFSLYSEDGNQFPFDTILGDLNLENYGQLFFRAEPVPLKFITPKGNALDLTMDYRTPVTFIPEMLRQETNDTFPDLEYSFQVINQENQLCKSPLLHSLLLFLLPNFPLFFFPLVFSSKTR
eukprot:TRINITY_DN2457_c0_g1_i2.p1 TRINITY_DN2457_c0_g1~~TRINITY_DN2457_c0_g1_i2.p1  ORF type:complete len:178 (-),score=36.98 TRINITY_DN2457_c0_g1_i2:66-578(-)